MQRFNFVTFHVQTPVPPGPQNVLQDDLGYVQLMDLMFRSALRFHPGARATILTDRATDLSAVCAPFTRSEHVVDPETLMLDRTLAQLDFLEHADPAEVLVLLDSDILVNGSLAPLLQDDFDVALTWRDNPQMPINGGFMLLQGRRPEVVRHFFRHFVQLYRERHAARSDWYGDQFALRDLLALPAGAFGRVDIVDIEGCRVRLLPCARYNFSPRNRTRAVLRPLHDPTVLHFNGSRKRLMRLYSDAHLSGRSAPREIARYYLKRQTHRLLRGLDSILHTRRHG